MKKKLITSFCLMMLIALPCQAQDMRLPDAAMNRDMETVKALLDEGLNPDTRGQFDTPALHWVVRVGDLGTAQALLDAGADAGISSRYGVTSLGLAVANGDFAMVKLLLEAGVDSNTREASGESVLMTASAVGVVESVNLLLNHGAVVDWRDPNFGQTALMLAAREGHADVVALLLSRGADPNASTRIGQTPAFIGPNSVPGFGFGIGIIRGGLPADRGRREPTPGGMSPLLYAARHNHQDIAELLLDAGADIDHTEANDIWSLLMAISNNQMQVAHYLIEQGAEINMSDWYGRSPLWEAVNVRNLYLHNATFENYIDREPLLELIKVLLEEGADVNARTAETPPFRHHLLNITGSLEWVDFTGQTPFLTAALAGDITVMKLLLEYAADPHIKTIQGTTALMAAAGINWVVAQTYTESPESLMEAVMLCWELGIDVNHTNSMGLTALHGATNRGSDDLIRFLVEKGANLEARDVEDRSPLDWAKGVFLATHPDEPKPSSMALITEFLITQGKEAR